MQRASDIEVQMVAARLRIAAEINRLEKLTEQDPGSSLGVTRNLMLTAENMQGSAEQAARLKQCPVLLRMVLDHTRPQADSVEGPVGRGGH